LSNKGLLPILWELFPDHPNLLPAYFEPGRIAGDWVEKPLLSREGANVAIHRATASVAADGDYGAEGRIFQAYAPIPHFGDDYMTIGSRGIGGEAAERAYGAEGRISQACAPTPHFGEDYMTIGSWVIGDEPAGIGLREDASEI